MSVIEELYSFFMKSNGVSTDSRNCKDGAIFFALKGERFNGNQYAKNVLANGASLAVVDEEALKGEAGMFYVSDVLKTLQELAQFHRRKLGLPIIAITGTNGKTTTKELVSMVLSERYSVSATVGNFNNHIGVPLTLLSFNGDTEIGVVEMGANHLGEIETLCEIAEPNYGLITNVGKAHLEGFGSFDGVKVAKGEMYSYLKKANRIIFINSGNEHLNEMAKDNRNRIEYGVAGSRVWGSVNDQSSKLIVDWTSDGERYYQVKTNLIGSYNLENVLCAIAVGIQFNVDLESINRAINRYEPQNNRSQFIETEWNKVVMDAYNANPTSMHAAIENFSLLSGENKVLVLGGMKELGADSKEEHEKLIRFIESKNIKEVYLLGSEFDNMELGELFHLYMDREALISRFEEMPIKGSYVLIKGSRSNQLEKLLPYF